MSLKPEHDCTRDGCHYEGSLWCIFCGLTAEDRGIRDCDREFGPHDHDDAECARILYDMSGDGISDYLAWESESYNRELEAESLGRPLFPNEY